MSLDTSKIEAVIFDYGNTLIELGGEQVVLLNDFLFKLVTSMFGACNKDSFAKIRHDQILTPYSNEDFIENDRVGICIELIEKLYAEKPTKEQIESMLELKQSSFVDVITAPPFLETLLLKLKERYRLAFISNYPCGASIHESLKKNRLDNMFESVVVSGDIGVVKPHPKIFQKCLNELDISAEKALYVGDNWLADIQGAKRIGMQAVHTTQYVSYEQFEPYEGDMMPDAVIGHLQELEKLLLK